MKLVIERPCDRPDHKRIRYTPTQSTI